MDIQRLRNLTTGVLHTEMSHVYEDLEAITGQSLLTHMIPRAMNAVEPWLRTHVSDERFWNKRLDVEHVGDFPLPVATDRDRNEMFERYRAQANPLEGKKVVLVKVGSV